LRRTLGAVTCACLCATWIAPARASGLDTLLACRRIAASSERLACFDRESATLAPAGAAANSASAVNSAPAANSAGAAPAAGAAYSASAAAEHAAPRPATAPTAPAAARLSPQQAFGMAPLQVLAREQAATRAPPPLDRLAAHIIALGTAADGREIFTLDNDQVWSQLEPDADLGARRGDAVTISRGWLGSYWLSLKSRHGCKVMRMR
jgi:hypothetical protein